ncbi:hypothetical protein PVAND_015381 [Polypedilum vanderplanki]|uniref:Ankyrin repeat protein n=1 Tax=Polypedilum vanderplanki TaxID=319348 RepID=A0A9J6BCV1_POLVA|nr:hypothetical protein PVAND_015381 [Polypedilum vanderplanki]
MSNVNKKLNFGNDDRPIESRNNGPMQPLIDFKQLANFLIQNVPSRDEAIEIVKNYSNDTNQNDPISIIFKIDEVLKPFDEENLRKFSEIPKKSNVIAFQSTYDGKFCVVWKHNEIFALNVLDDLRYDDLVDLCKFVVKFISKCLKENHSGIKKSKYKSTSKHNLSLASLIDSNDLNLLHIASQIGNTKIVKILLENGFSVDTWCNRRLPADRAYENRHFGTLLELLKANSQLPKGFNINECPYDIQEFVRAKNGGRDKPKARKGKILMTILLYAIISFPLLAMLTFFFVYDPTMLWKDLDEVQKEQVLNGTVKFEGIEMKFRELYNENDSNVFDILNYEQILVLMRDKVLDLSKEKNRFLETEIYLSYGNMSEILREKFESAVVKFQGKSLKIYELVGNETEIYESLKSSEIFDLLKNESLIEIGSKLKFNGVNFDDKNLTLNSIETGQNLLISPGNLLKGNKLILLNSDTMNSNVSNVKNLLIHLKQKFPFKWFEYFNLQEYTPLLTDIVNSKFNVEEILSKFVSANSHFEKEVLKKFIDDQNLVIFWDGFDDISFNFIDFLLHLISTVKDETQNVQFIATHPQYEQFIAKKFDNKIYKLVL